MRETASSLRMYFILTGLLGTFTAVCSLVPMLVVPDQSLGHFLLILMLLGQGALSVAFLWLGFKLKDLLVSRPRVPLRVVMVATTFSLLSLIGMFWFIGLMALPMKGLGLAIDVYLWYQLKRLAAEAPPVLESQVLE